MEASQILKEAYAIIQSGTDSNNDGGSLQVLQMPGDASIRRYYRVLDTNNPGQHYVLMSADAFAAEEYSFLLVQNLLQKQGIPVPEVKACVETDGTILLSDLGDSTMLHCLEASMEESVEVAMFQKAIDLMLKIHRIKEKEDEPHGLKAFSTAFDEELLMWEVNFTIEYFLLNYLERKLPKKDLEGIRAAFTDICQRLSKEPRIFTHRDYHTRNIMVTADDTYHSIDFQDARMGPRQYDLASLLRDSYYQMKEQKVYSLLKYYYGSAKEAGDINCSLEEFERVFDLMSIQRNFKAIGSFASFYTRREDAKYLRFIGNTFENVRRNLAKFPEYKELHQLLFSWYYF